MEKVKQKPTEGNTTCDKIQHISRDTVPFNQRILQGGGGGQPDTELRAHLHRQRGHQL